MLLRKINAALSLLVTVMLMDHAAFHGIWMLSKGSIPHAATKLPFILMGLMFVHAILSIILAIRTHKGTKKGKYKTYANKNLPTYIQRASGISLVLLTVLHVAGTVGVLQPPPLVHAILPPLFFAVALAHVALSVEKAFVSLGVGSKKVIFGIGLTAKILCGLTLVIDVVGFYLYLV